MQWVLLFLTCMAGSAIQGMTGFGFGIFVMAVLPFFLPVPALSVGVCILSFINCASIVMKKWKSIDYRIMLVPACISFIGRYIGINILMRIETGPFKMALGIVLILISFYFMFSRNLVIKPNLVNGSVTGMISGILGGLFNISGPPLVIYYMSAIKDKNVYLATIQATFFVSNLFSLFLHGLYGRITLEACGIAGIGFAAVLIGSYLGLKLFDRLNRETIKKLVYLFMLLMGVIMVLT